MEFKTSVGAALQGAAKPLPIAVVAITIIIYYCTAFWSKLHRVRAIYREYPGLPHHPIWGHMVAIGELFKDDRHFDYIVEQIWLKLNKPPFFVMDSWPLTRPNVIVICDAELSERLSKPTVEQPYSWPKSPTYEDLRNLFADDSIVRAHGEEWRQLRKKYGPGFNSRYLQGLLPEMIQEIKIYTSKLEASVGQVITLGDFVTSLTIDIICAIVLGYSTGAQLQGSELTVGFQGCLEWQVRQESINPFHLYNPLRPVAMFYYEGKLNRAIDNEIIDAFTKKDQLNRRSVIALAIENEKSGVPQPDVLRKSRNQIKTFLLAGHDTTSTFLQYLYYELSLHPEILAKVRAEQKSIFGSEKSGYHERIEKMLLEHPEQVFQGMVYTTAVMKEGLRFHSIAGGSKWVPKGNNLTAEYEGKSYLLDCHTLHLASSISHMDPKYWGPDAHLFNPDRWLENAGWKVPVSAFRPFERGPRACIAQELVYLEARIILAFTVNTYEFEKVFDTKYKELYSIRKITAKPNDGMRMRVSKVEW